MNHGPSLLSRVRTLLIVGLIGCIGPGPSSVGRAQDKYRFAWERVRDVTFEDLARWSKGDMLR